jgi:two-component system chemotaxis response regulator CheB
MGDDGARAMGDVKAAGGLTIAQSEESCVVYGMPKAAIERGHASRVLALDAIAAALLAECGWDNQNQTAPGPRLTALAAGSGKN